MSAVLTQGFFAEQDGDKKNVQILGPTRSGKSTLLQILLLQSTRTHGASPQKPLGSADPTQGAAQ